MIKKLWKYWFHWLPSMTLMETWTWMNNIFLCTKHMLVYMDVECNSFQIRTNWNRIRAIYIYKHMWVQYLKVIFASSDMILNVVIDERTYLPFDNQLWWQESVTYIWVLLSGSFLVEVWHPINLGRVAYVCFVKS